MREDDAALGALSHQIEAHQERAETVVVVRGMGPRLAIGPTS